MTISENVKEYWATKELMAYGDYRISLSDMGIIKDDDDLKVNRFRFKIKGNDYNVDFYIEEETFHWDDGTSDISWLIWLDGEVINDYVDYAESLDDCIMNCIYYFSTRF